MKSRKLSFRLTVFASSIIIFGGNILLGQTFGDREGQRVNEVADGIIIVKMHENIPVQGGALMKGMPSLEHKISKHGVYAVEKTLPFLEYSKDEAARPLRRIYTFSYSSGEDPHLVAQAFSVDPNVEYAEPKYLVYISSIPDDPEYDGMTQLARVQAPEAWDVVKGESGNVIIAIVDTGTDWDHADLQANVWTNPGEIADNGIDDDGNGFIDDVHGWNFANDTNDPSGLPVTPNNYIHGTHVAGIAAGVTNNGIGIASLSWNCTFMPINTADPQDDWYLRYAYEGVVYATANGADIINASWSGVGYHSQFIQDVVDFAHDSGVLIVASAGNMAGNNDNAQHDIQCYPSNIEGVLSVGATEKTSDARADFSNFGITVDVFAPGNNILSTLPDDNYGELSGTSMSAPLVSGLAGLVKTLHPDWTNDQIREQIRMTCDNIDAANPGCGGLLGKGRINAYRAVTETGHPSIRIAKTTFTESGGDGVIHAGDIVDLRIDFINYLDAAANTAVFLTSLNEGATMIQDYGLMPYLASDSTASLDFQFTVSPDADNDDKLRFAVSITSNGYSDRDLVSLAVNPDETYTATHASPQVQTSITTQGNIGWLDFQGSQGSGFQYLGKNVLYEGGLMIGTSATQVSDCIRGEDVNVQDDDFEAVTNLEIVSPGLYFGFNEEGFVVLKDSQAENPIGVEIGQISVLGVSNMPLADGVLGLLYNIWNTGDMDINDLYIGLFFDWDIGQDKLDKAAFDSERSMSYVYNNDAQPISFLSTKLLTHDIGVSYRTINNVDELNDGFTDEEKWAFLSGGIQTTNLNDTNVSTLLSAGPLTIPANDGIDVAFAIIAAQNFVLLRLIADQCQILFDQLTDIPSEERVLPSHFELEQNYPNPFNLSTTINYSLPRPSFVQLKIYNLLGNEIEILVESQQPAGKYNVIWNARHLPCGIYLYQLIAEDYIETRKLILQK